MSIVRTASLAALVALAACGKSAPPEHAESEHAEAKADAGGEHDKALAEHEEADASLAFAVPFTDEQHDPLVLTKGFVRDMLADNASYTRRHDPSFFKAFAASQSPRATVVTCSDSRVQSPAFDSAAENDAFFVRNIGNQVENNEGSVEYGVRHLKTPVLLVLGHTGCGAVKAAMGDYSGESEGIRKELDSLHVPKRKEGVRDDESGPWLDAVVDNVHDQVAAALRAFGEDVAKGKLTVVGAVYDLRNDMKQGFGKITIVDVNGFSDAAKIAAFEKGVQGVFDGRGGASDAGPPVREVNNAGDAQKALADIRDAIAAKEGSKEAPKR